MFRRGFFLVSSTMASFTIPFISIAVNIALPTIAKSFNLDVAFVNWFANIFLISMASTILFLGVIADWLGKELLFIIGTIFFAAATFSILYVSDFKLLLVFRCIQGFGAAMISGTAVAILADIFPRNTGLFIGINTTAVYAGTTLGPALGGFLINYAGWFSLFTFTGTLALISAIIALLSLDFKKRSEGRKPYLQTLFVFMLSTIAISTGSAYVSQIYGLAALSIGLAMLISVLYVEYKKSLNLVKQIFEANTFLAYVVALLNYVATYALSILYSNFLQVEMKLTPNLVGMILLAQPVPQVLLSPLAGYLSDKINPGLVVTAGMVLITLGIGTALIFYKWLKLLIISLIMLGIGFAFFASPNTTQIMRKIPREAFASALSFLGLMRFLGQSLSTSVLTAIMLALKNPTPMEATLTTYMIIAAIGTIIAAISIQYSKSG